MGMLFRTFSEIDIEELRNVYDAIDERRKIDEIDRESIVCTYEGHTVFSIFSDYDSVYE